MSGIIINICVLMVSLGCLVIAAQKTVDGLITIAQAYRIPDALIAMSVIAVGTSLPEIGSHVIASIGIVSGNLPLELTSSTIIGGNMGSSTVQQILFMGILFIGIGSHQYARRVFVDTYLPMLGTFVVVFGLGYDGLLSHVDGTILLLIFGGYMVTSFYYRDQNLEVAESTEPKSIRWNVAIATVGFAVVITSAYFSLTFVEKLVEQLGMSGSMAGMISIGFAAALPELSTVVESIRRENPYLALGTLVGSNVVNPLVGIGGGALVSSYVVPTSLLTWDLPFKFVVGLVLLIWLYVYRNFRAGIREGVFLLISYFVYLSVRMLVFV